MRKSKKDFFECGQSWLFPELERRPVRPAPPYFDSPKNDNELLLNFQHAALNGGASAWNGMYQLGFEVALKYINLQCRRCRQLTALSCEARREKAHNAITYIIARYYEQPDFCIEKSFTSYLYMRVQHELFYKRKVDEIVTFVDAEKLDMLKK